MARTSGLNVAFGIETIYIPFKGSGNMTASILGRQVHGAVI